jgi:hypothetical protein
VLVTARLREGLRSLRTRAAHGVLVRALAAGSRGEFRVVEYSAQSNHLHLLVEAQDERALGRGPTPDPFSSAGCFAGWSRKNGRKLEPVSRFLPLARTWLLALGWRRHGLLDPRELPRASGA